MFLKIPRAYTTQQCTRVRFFISVFIYILDFITSPYCASVRSSIHVECQSAQMPELLIGRKRFSCQTYFTFPPVKLWYRSLNSLCTEVRKNTRAVEHIPIPEVLGRSTAKGRLVSIGISHKFVGGRRRPVFKTRTSRQWMYHSDLVAFQSTSKGTSNQVVIKQIKVFTILVVQKI